MKTYLLTSVALLSCVACQANALFRVDNSGPSKEVKFKMTKGVNLSHWWAQRPLSDYSATWLDHEVKPEEVYAIKEIGFRHVRLPISPEALGMIGDLPPDPERIELLKRQVADFKNAGLFTILDLHPDESEKRLIFVDREIMVKYKLFWKTLALTFRDAPEDEIAYEVLNEPNSKQPEMWWRRQAELITVIRREDDTHTIIVAADGYSTINELVKQRPYADKNLVYNFHFYDPFTFTHQGAPYLGDRGLDKIFGLEYPNSNANVRSRAQYVSNANALKLINEYGSQTWNKRELEKRIKKATEWARAHKVTLSMTEFGCWRYQAPPQSRLAWLSDVRSIADRNNILWSHWEWRGAFGLTDTKRPMQTIDPAVIKALGLPKSRYSEMKVNR